MPNTTWNPSDKAASVTLSNSNLTATLATGRGGTRSLDSKGAGKFYFEVALNPAAAGNADVGFGVLTGDAPLNTWTLNGLVGAITLEQVVGRLSIDGVTQVNLGAMANGAIGCIALDLDNRRVWFRAGAAGNWNNNASYDPATGVGGYSIQRFLNYHPVVLFDSAGIAGTNAIANFGDTAFSGAVPSGFTSGWPTGSAPLLAGVTQVALEEWAMPNASAQMTQVVLEQWVSVPTVNSRAVLTQIALEEWTSVAISAGAPIITMIG